MHSNGIIALNKIQMAYRNAQITRCAPPPPNDHPPYSSHEMYYRLEILLECSYSDY